MSVDQSTYTPSSRTLEVSRETQAVLDLWEQNVNAVAAKFGETSSEYRMSEQSLRVTLLGILRLGGSLYAVGNELQGNCASGDSYGVIFHPHGEDTGDGVRYGHYSVNS